MNISKNLPVPSARATGLTPRLLLFVCVRTLLNVAIRMVYPYLGVFQRGLGVEMRALAFGISLRSASGIFSPFLATVGDRFSRRTGMLFGLGMFTVGLSLVIIWPSFPAFLAMMVITNLGTLVFLPSMQAYLGDRVPYENRGSVLAITEFSWSFSFIFGIPLMGLMIRQHGWQAPFPILVALGVLALVGIFSMLPRDSSGANKSSNFRHNLGIVLANPRALAGLGMAMACSAANEMVSVTFGVWLEEAFQVKIAALAATAFIIGASELGGEGLASVFVDRLGKMTSFRIGLILNTLAVLTLPFLGTRLGGAMAGLLLLFLTFEFCIVSIIPLMTEMLPSARATYMAAFIASIAMGRALTDLVALPLYTGGQNSQLGSGVLAVALAAAGINLISLLISRLVKIENQPVAASLPKKV